MVEPHFDVTFEGRPLFSSMIARAQAADTPFTAVVNGRAAFTGCLGLAGLAAAKLPRLTRVPAGQSKPLLGHRWRQTPKESSSNMRVHAVAGDILLLDDLMDTISRVVAQSKQDWVLTAERWDVDDLPALSGSQRLAAGQGPTSQEIREHVKRGGQLHTCVSPVLQDWMRLYRAEPARFC